MNLPDEVLIAKECLDNGSGVFRPVVSIAVRREGWRVVCTRNTNNK